ncbi:Gamma-glutamyltranspeptidase [Methylophaga frappieri]|uniref:Glutathione hydrolase proenzyme n=1 Tax=Methylophaga frappieri (strain ATCC BAA-2434 / DSM 25690 / JAM7) TaxID=754477 RepID=I1YFX0_METFJ|nr:gamma-glutamyltransferase [Methylophaga frappieri]AFJ01813.1 Gamma-glutamyltranspeptidase [Methylophaga frappieri]
MRYLLLFFITYTLLSPTVFAQNQAAIASAHPLATEAGFEILEAGGNAFDAAIAVSAALAVVEPAGSGIGGGGFWLLQAAQADRAVMIDGRETAPSRATADMYQNDDDTVNRDLSLNHPLGAGIPGLIAGLDRIQRDYGKLPLSISLAPAIRYAEQGFPVTARYRRMLSFRHSRFNDTAKQVLMPGGDLPEIGDLIRQPDLAKTLRLIASEGGQAFYQGKLAEQMVNAVNRAGGIWQEADLAAYQAKQREAVTSQYLNYHITSVNLPSAGGILLINMLNQLQELDYQHAPPALRRHYLAEVMRRAYFVRSEHLGDSDFVDVPTFLTDSDFARELSQSINPNQATVSATGLAPVAGKGEDTTHFSILDTEGNRVAATLSVNYPFGTGFMVPGTGVLLNNEMDDFSAKIGEPNAYELVSQSANQIEPGKRPLSSMTPTFVENSEQLLILGTPGGSRIITMVLQGILAFIDDQSAQQIVSSPRLHHQYLPDQITVETPGFDAAVIDSLENKGHHVKSLDRQFGNMQLLIADKITGKVDAASDPRGEGSAVVRFIQSD